MLGIGRRGPMPRSRFWAWLSLPRWF